MHEDYVNRLEDLLKGSIKSTLNDMDDCALSYSGGLDCSVVGKVTSEIKNIKLYVAGTEKCQDFEAAVVGANILKLPLEKIIITKDDVERALPEIIKILQTHNALEISIELSLYFVCRSIKETILLTGQGADELFGGYSRYLRMESDEREERMIYDMNYYLQHSRNQESKLAANFQKSLVTPYTTESIINYIQALPMDQKVRRSERKYLLKLLARKLELPTEIVDRPKKAVQYGSGLQNLLKTLAKDRGLELHEYLRQV